MGFIYAFLPKEREHSRQQVHGECKRAEQELTTTTATPFDRCCDRNKYFREHQRRAKRIQKFIHKKPAPLLINVNYDYGHYDIPRRMPTRCARPPHHHAMPRHHNEMLLG
jgi:hypothetical protein